MISILLWKLEQIYKLIQIASSCPDCMKNLKVALRWDVQFFYLLYQSIAFSLKPSPCPWLAIDIHHKRSCFVSERHRNNSQESIVQPYILLDTLLTAAWSSLLMEHLPSGQVCVISLQNQWIDPGATENQGGEFMVWMSRQNFDVI